VPPHVGFYDGDLTAQKTNQLRHVGKMAHAKRTGAANDLMLTNQLEQCSAPVESLWDNDIHEIGYTAGGLALSKCGMWYHLVEIAC
jgi:hypothetical protein